VLFLPGQTCPRTLPCREVDIERFFNGFGRLKQVVLKRGYGFVFFEEQRDAEDAVKELVGRKLRGETITLEFAKGDGCEEGRRFISFAQYRIKVENLSSSTSWQDVKDYMKQAGEVLYCKTHHDRRGHGRVLQEGGHGVGPGQVGRHQVCREENQVDWDEGVKVKGIIMNWMKSLKTHEQPQWTWVIVNTLIEPFP
jgi:hypothetical protein